MDYFAHETAIIDEGALIGENTRIWHFSHIMTGVTIGASCTLGQNVFISTGVLLGSKVKVQNNVSIYQGVICEDEVFLGPSMVFTNIRNPRSAISRKEEFETTRFRKGVSIGANATILCGIEIGEYAFIGAGSVVLESVKAYELVVGNPGKRIGWMSKLGHQLDFNEEGFAFCEESAQRYKLENDHVRIA